MSHRAPLKALTPHAWLSFTAATSQVRDLSCGLQLCHKCKRPARAVRYFRLRTGEDELESDPQVDQMKQRLKFHFMNPFQKWSYAPKQRFPWKMLLQIVNMILVVVQVQYRLGALLVICLCSVGVHVAVVLCGLGSVWCMYTVATDYPNVVSFTICCSSESYVVCSKYSSFSKHITTAVFRRTPI